MFAKIQRVHFVGIGGIGMSGIAEILLTLGFKVSGSDLKDSATTERLKQLGATIYVGHHRQNVAGAEVVVTSSAIARDNPEVLEARSTKIALVQRAEMLAELMRLKYGIAVAGMHGKTTTTSMIAAVLAAGGMDPTVVVGGRVDALGSNARLGKSHFLVVEADESDRSFLKLSPIIAVVTNIDREHMDCYRDMEDVQHTFVSFLDRLPFYGMAVICNDDERARALIPHLSKRVVTYGLQEGSDFCVRLLPQPAQVGDRSPISAFSVRYNGGSLGDFELFVPGIHNVLNAAAAVAVGTGLDVPPDVIRAALAQFSGVDRRFHLKGKANGISVVDDYGHHPTEIRATLAAARQCAFRRVHVIFQPHRYTRTRDLMDQFSGCFTDCDTLQVLDIYAASEEPLPGITGESLAKRIPHATYAPSFDAAIDNVIHSAQDGDLVITMGAGNVSQLGAQILRALEARAAAHR